MKMQLQSYDGREQKTLHIDKYPDMCPICFHKNIVNPRYYTYRNENEAQISFQCSNEKCQSLFIGYYKSTLTILGLSLTKIQPLAHLDLDFPEVIQECSNKFVIIYNQSKAAEESGLDEIAGVGYRKALEFLIKDYLVKLHPTNENEIKSMFLGRCIKELIDDKKIQICAERATWLGNDETHYIRGWDTKDITDLKKLIKITTNWIENSLLTEDYLNQMPSGIK